MMYNIISNLEYCGSYVNDIADLLLYSHVPIIAIVLFVAFFIYSSNKKLLLGKIFFALSLTFSVWAVLNLTIWLKYDEPSDLMFSWSLIEIFSVLLFILCFYFVYVFINKKDLPFRQKILVFLPLLPIIVFAPTELYLSMYDMQECIGTESSLYIEYVRWIKIFFATLTLSYLVFSFIKNKARDARKQIAILTVGIVAFLYSFLTAGYIAEQTINYTYEFYGLFVIIAFIGALAYLIVRYATFNIKLIGAQALMVALILLTGSRLFFSIDVTGFVISAATFILACIFGFFLVRSVKHEVTLREALEIANKRQQETLRFITHEVKGYLTDGAAALDAILTESFGSVTQDTKAMVGEALTKNRNAVREIQNFLRIADFKTGKVSYAVETFDFKQKLEETLAPLEENAKNKGLSFTTEIAQGEYTVVGDADQLLGHVVGNLINNAISYTPQGEIAVRLARSDGMLLFSVKDSGVGLSDDDKTVLFTEGGHGKESRTVNPHSTGYGLFIARRIVEAHKGRLWAESEGRGKGSTFLVELPTTLSPKDFGK